MPVSCPTATVYSSGAIKYIGNEILWRELLEKYPTLLKPIRTTGTGARQQKTYLVKVIDLALDAAQADGVFVDEEA
jgi:hypothetical protein